MDITLIRTFLEVGASGSFVTAARRLYVTQSAVSLRVQRLEDTLGRQLFRRSKAGAEMTPEGRAFEPYALSLLKIWEEARQQVAIPEGFDESLTIGAQYSLWPRLGFRWIDRLRERRPRLSIRGEVGMPDRLIRFLVEGVVQMGLLYSPQMRPGLAVERVLDEELVMVASWPDPDAAEIEGRYLFCDWGPEFVHAHALHLPHLTGTGLTLALGDLARRFAATRRLACYVPARAAREQLDAGTLWLVPDMPRFAYPAWLVWREDLDPDLARAARDALGDVARALDAEQTETLARLDAISEDGEAPRMGETS